MARDQWPATAGMRSIQPVALSAASVIPGLATGSRTRRLTFRVDVERIEPVIRASGGPITVIDVPVIALDSPPNGPVEQPDEGFTVESELPACVIRAMMTQERAARLQSRAARDRGA